MMEKLKVLLTGSNGDYGTATLEFPTADDLKLFLLGGTAVWVDKVFRSKYAYGAPPDPFPLYEANVVTIAALDDDRVFQNPPVLQPNPPTPPTSEPSC